VTSRRIIVLIPAHNEREGIADTVRSLQSQTRAPDFIYVIDDNSTDETADIADGLGALVIRTVGNTAKKAGALNQGLDMVLGTLRDHDLVLLVDADSILCPEWIERGVRHLASDPRMGAVSGAYVARKGRGLVTLLQRAEYAQERRRIARRGGRVDVLSGTAVMTSAGLLRDLVARRGHVYDEASLTEDFEVTLAMQALGYQPRCFKDLRVVTDVMETWPDLARQRIRWQRGTVETLRAYGWTPLTRRLWRTQIVSYASTLITLAILTAWGLAIAGGIEDFDRRWLLLFPLFIVEQVVATRRSGWAPTIVAALLVPMWFYDMFRLGIYWIALTRSLRRAPAVWA
jgi:biofilm PGA synthesis N-glycosyltransferase PgaC